LKPFFLESKADINIKENVSVGLYDTQALEDESTPNFQNVKCTEFKSDVPVQLIVRCNEPAPFLRA
jgi:hypothetical protein